MVSNLPIQPLSGQFKIADPETGLPTVEFMLYMKAMYDLLPEQEIELEEAQENITSLSEREIIAGVGLGGGGTLAADVTLDLEDTAVTPGSYTNTNLTVDQQGRITAAANGSGGGGGWGLASTTVIGSPVANVDVTGIGNANEILIICEAVTMSSSDVPVVHVSVDNGSSFFTTSGDYVRASANGTIVSTTHGASFWSANATAARYGTVRILAPSTANSPPVFMAYPNTASPMGLFLADLANDIDAIRIAGAAAANLTGGTIYVLTR